jgi:3-oxoacyl-[acyl-carrier protein] reductase/bacilysin biosynthesis oxidoreductase BacG
MELGLHGKKALVTGASQGIGLAIARALALEGVSVGLVARTRERLGAAVRDIRAVAPAPVEVLALPGDVGQLSEVERISAAALNQLGQVDILVNNAATTHTGPFFEMSDEDLVTTWQVKALGYMRLTRVIAPHMMARRSGAIINIVGGAARTPALDFIAGSMVNAALVNFTRGISRELARHNVRVNAVSPGWTMTERQEHSFALQAAARQMSAQDVERQQSRSIPLNRLVTAQEVAALVLMLASDQLPSMTGEDIIIDGGATPSI